MTGIYFSALVIGIIMLTLSAVFGHDHDIPHADGTVDGPSITNLKVIMAFLAAFGGSGLIGQYYAVGAGMSVAVALGGGLSLGLIVWRLLDRVYKEQSSSFIPSATLVGRQGTLTVPIADHATGEVQIAHPAGHQTYLARNRDGVPMAGGLLVKVVDIVGEYAIVEPAIERERIS